MIPFAELAAQGCPPHGELALALAAELGDGPAESARAAAAIEEIAAALADARSLPAREQLAACGRELAGRMRARVRPGVVDDLLLDRALLNATGDPVCWAIACVEAAGRAGIPLGIVADDDDHLLVGHRELEAPLVLEPLAPRTVLDAADLPAAGDLSWRCSHRTALTLLDRVVARAERTGRHGLALHAARLRLDLPLDEPTRARLRTEQAQLAGRLN